MMKYLVLILCLLGLGIQATIVRWEYRRIEVLQRTVYEQTELIQKQKREMGWYQTGMNSCDWLLDYEGTPQKGEPKR